MCTGFAEDHCMMITYQIIMDVTDNESSHLQSVKSKQDSIYCSNKKTSL